MNTFDALLKTLEAAYALEDEPLQDATLALLRKRVIHHMGPEDLFNARERAYKPTEEYTDYYKAIGKIFLAGFIVHRGFIA